MLSYSEGEEEESDEDDDEEDDDMDEEEEEVRRNTVMLRKIRFNFYFSPHRLKRMEVTKRMKMKMTGSTLTARLHRVTKQANVLRHPLYQNCMTFRS